MPARDRADPPDPGAPLPYRPPADGRFRLRLALQDQGRAPRPPEPGRFGRPEPAGPARLPAGLGAPADRGTFALGSGSAGGFASLAEGAGSGAMTQAFRNS